jgi:hypothetical protein
MKPRLLLAALVLASLASTGCQALGIGSSTLDSASAAQNAKNVREIAAENADLGVKAGLVPASLDASLKRNAAAVTLADAMAADAAK